MNYVRAGLLAVCMVASFANAEERDKRVHAAEPTVVTVHGLTDGLDVKPSPARSKRRMNPLRIGGLKALTGSANVAGWMMNVNEDIPARHEKLQYRNTPADRR
jgi:hypothetical protein